MGLEGGLCINNFHPPDCGGANHDNRHDGNNAPPLASERSERAGGGGQKFPRNGGGEANEVSLLSSPRFGPKPNPIMQNQKWGWKGVFDSSISIPLTVGVRLLFINMMGTTHPHSQGRVAPALGGGYQRFPRNEGGRGERSEPTLPPAFRFPRNGGRRGE